ncbi:hypothetical protein C8Q80DRAFT_1094670 [Daedaleopsis nitida]|nr:hypothetical protein C8Q80DRAFT_1094670 [Daedaleopsis nitida]
MPRDLPGLYWDEEKRRYFPLASRPADRRPAPLPDPPPTERPTTQERTSTSSRRQRPARTSNSPPSNKRHHLWKEPDEALNCHVNQDRRLSLHALRSLPPSMAASADLLYLDRTNLTSRILQANGNDRKLLVGDSTGWLYSVDTDDPDHAVREFGLRTQITSITRSGQVCMVTSLGSPVRLLVNRDDSIGLWVLRDIPPHVCSDVWCGQVWDRKVTLGGRKASLCFLDIERNEYIRLNRTSDVLSLCLQDQNITFTGMRNGIIDRWDSRQPGGKTDVVVNMSNSSEEREPGNRWAASVDYLRIIHDHELLVRTIRGDLETHDLRFLRQSEPVLRFNGHVPSYGTLLGITVDPNQNFVLAGGGDCHLRMWSLRTGELSSHNEHTLPVRLDGNMVTPSKPIRAMEIVKDDARAWLWLAFDRHFNRIDLGPESLFC